MSESRTFPLYPHQRKAVDALVAAANSGGTIIVSIPRGAGKSTSYAEAREALRRSRAQPEQHVIDQPTEAHVLDTLGNKGREHQRLMADFDRMFGGSK